MLARASCTGNTERSLPIVGLHQCGKGCSGGAVQSQPCQRGNTGGLAAGGTDRQMLAGSPRRRACLETVAPFAKSSVRTRAWPENKRTVQHKHSALPPSGNGELHAARRFRTEPGETAIERSPAGKQPLEGVRELNAQNTPRFTNGRAATVPHSSPESSRTLQFRGRVGLPDTLDYFQGD